MDSDRGMTPEPHLGDAAGSRVDWDVVVVGAGLAGLAAAATAADGGASVLVLDRAPGGRAATEQVGRFRFNRGAHALYRRGPGREVLKRLGVEVTGALPPRKGGLGQLHGRVGLLPLGARSLRRSDLFGNRTRAVLARAVVGVMRPRPDRLAGRSAADWFHQLAGGNEEARAYIEMLGRIATFCADFDLVSADLAASQLQSAIRGDVEYPHGGWGTLVDGLMDVARSRGARLDLATPVRRVAPFGERVQVQTAERAVTTRSVILAAGTPAANSSLLLEPPPAWSGLGPPARVAALGLGLTTVPEPALLWGIDQPLYLIRHGPPARGLAPEGAAMVEVMRYLRPDEKLAPGAARDEMEGFCRAAGIEPATAEEVRYLHDMVVCPALPLPESGGMAGRPDVASTGQEGVLVAGDWVGPTGHLADAALVSGEAAGRRAVQDVDRRSARHRIPQSVQVGSATAGEPPNGTAGSTAA